MTSIYSNKIYVYEFNYLSESLFVARAHSIRLTVKFMKASHEQQN